MNQVLAWFLIFSFQIYPFSLSFLYFLMPSFILLFPLKLSFNFSLHFPFSLTFFDLSYILWGSHFLRGFLYTLTAFFFYLSWVSFHSALSFFTLNIIRCVLSILYSCFSFSAFFSPFIYLFWPILQSAFLFPFTHIISFFPFISLPADPFIPPFLFFFYAPFMLPFF